MPPIDEVEPVPCPPDCDHADHSWPKVTVFQSEIPVPGAPPHLPPEEKRALRVAQREERRAARAAREARAAELAANPTPGAEVIPVEPPAEGA